MKKNLVSVIMFLAVVLFAIPAIAGEPTEIIRAGMDKVVAVVNDPKWNYDEGIPEEMVEELREAVYSFLDYRELTKRAVGKPWKNMPDDQREELAETFRERLEKTYLKKLQEEFIEELKDFNEESIKYVGEQQQGKMALVNTLMTSAGTEASVDFKLYNTPDGWVAYDITGEGVNLLGLFKDDIRQYLIDHTVEELIARQKELIKELDEQSAAETQ